MPPSMPLAVPCWVRLVVCLALGHLEVEGAEVWAWGLYYPGGLSGVVPSRPLPLGFAAWELVAFPEQPPPPYTGTSRASGAGRTGRSGRSLWMTVPGTSLPGRRAPSLSPSPTSALTWSVGTKCCTGRWQLGREPRCPGSPASMEWREGRVFYPIWLRQRHTKSSLAVSKDGDSHLSGQSVPCQARKSFPIPSLSFPCCHLSPCSHRELSFSIFCRPLH